MSWGVGDFDRRDGRVADAGTGDWQHRQARHQSDFSEFHAQLDQHAAAQQNFAPRLAAGHRDVADPRQAVALRFRQARLEHRATPQQWALALGCDVSLVAALEAGAFDQLLDWAQVVNAVMAMSRLSPIDANALLQGIAQDPAIAAQLRPRERRTYRKQVIVQPARPTASPGGRAAPRPLPPRRARPGKMVRAAQTLPKRTLRQVRRRPKLALYSLTLPFGLLLFSMSSAAFSPISGPVDRLARHVSDAVSVMLSPIHDGHVWIDVDDPRSRRADKLQIRGR